MEKESQEMGKASLLLASPGGASLQTCFVQELNALIVEATFS